MTSRHTSAFARDRIRCNGILTGWKEMPGEAETQRRFHGAGSDWAEQAAARLPMGQLVEYDQFVAGAYPE
jgi:hypothetical protein